MAALQIPEQYKFMLPCVFYIGFKVITSMDVVCIVGLCGGDILGLMALCPNSFFNNTKHHPHKFTKQTLATYKEEYCCLVNLSPK